MGEYLTLFRAELNGSLRIESMRGMNVSSSRPPATSPNMHIRSAVPIAIVR